ncbi:MAG: bifunctional adenosylcobinamide kinase/adenosylcobinamide-phosphate guanylyltransferase [Lachnospiraceae bacterium]|nr:bifunctional adenosylcobinamide kinase/adenosylcobinamide-phosphate guanylyltransferase [Lachnospiraceae bacterium]
MIFITGPKYSGKKEYVKELFSDTGETYDDCVFDAEMLVADTMSDEEIKILADHLASKRAVTASEIGSGVVPTDKSQREFRERAGLLSGLLAQRADTVIRMICGIPQILKDTK